MKDLKIMAEIQAQKEKEVDSQGTRELDDEEKELARTKREAFDFPVNAVSSFSASPAPYS